MGKLLTMEEVLKLVGQAPLCKNCLERAPLENTPFCEICRDEMEDRYAEETRACACHAEY